MSLLYVSGKGNRRNNLILVNTLKYKVNIARHTVLLLLTHSQCKFQECLRGQRHPLQNSFSFHMGLYQQAAASKALFLPNRQAICANFSLKALQGQGIPTKVPQGS